MIKYCLFYLQWKWETILLGFCFLIFLLVARFIVSIIYITNELKFAILFHLSFEVICDSGLKNTEYKKTEALLGFSSSSVNICHSFKSFDLSSKIQI